MPIVACGLFLCLAFLGGCGSRNSAPTPEQNRQLANADEMLNEAPEALANVDANAMDRPPQGGANVVSR